MKYMALFAFLVTLPSAWAFDAGGVYIGNGGQGLVVNGELVLRDLYDAGVHANPVIGQKIHPEIQKMLADSPLRNSGISMRLLARKLTDLQSLVNNLGYYGAKAAGYYEWKFVESDLPDVWAEDPQAVYTTLALRHLNIVYVHAPSWRAMNPSQRVALVIHEIVSAMLIPECDAEGFCHLSNGKVREIVAKLFSDSKESELLRALAIHFPEREAPVRYHRNAIEFFGLESKTFESLNSPGKRVTALKKICASAGKKEIPVRISFFRMPYQVRTVSYSSNVHGIVYRQSHLDPYYAVPNAIRRFSGEEWIRMKPADCFDSLSTFVSQWFSYTWPVSPDKTM